MIDLDDHTLFTPVVHPESGVTVHVLTRRVAPVQQSFYFVNDGMSADGRYLWFYCAFPPAGHAANGRTLGVVDFETGEMRRFPETQFGEASPWVDPDSGCVYWQQDRHVWKRGPRPDAEVELVNSVPDDLIGARQVRRTATHLTPSADRKAFFIDLGLELQWIFGSLPLDGGDFEFWHRFDRLHDHAQFSPTDPDTVLFAEENHPDPITGLTFPITNRMWSIQRGRPPRPIMPSPTRVSHEWWDRDGKHVWCAAGKETWRVRLTDGEAEKISFPRHCWHSHGSRDGRLVVGDSNNGFFRGCPSVVHLLNRDTEKSVLLVENPARDDYVGRNYHIDPHPRFCCGDRYIVFTTTILGNVDVAVARTDDVAEYTS